MERSGPDPDFDAFLSPAGDDRQQAEFEFLSRICSRYFLEDRTQAEIAAEFGLSRQKVQRMIQRGRDQGIVEIHVHAAPVQHIQLERHLKAVFGLRDALIAGFHPDEEICRRSVARVAAGYLERQLADGSVVAVGLGRNTNAVATAFNPRRKLSCTFVSAMGGSPGFGVAINPNEVCAMFAAQSGGRAEALYAPAFVEEPELHDPLLRQPAIAETLGLARRAAVAVIGIGTPADNSILVQAKCISRRQARHLRETGAIGEILGNFYDSRGRGVHSPLDDRLISVTLGEIARIPKVIGVASEAEKSGAIAGALRGGAIDVLITDSDNALAVLRQAGVTALRKEAFPLGGNDD